MEVKKYYISYYISYQKEITQNNLNVWDVVKEIVQRQSSFVTVFATFPESETTKCLQTDFFMYFVQSEVCHTAISGYLGSVVECLWDRIT